MSDANVIQNIWTGSKKNTLRSTTGPFKLYSGNLKNLAPGKLLESELDLLQYEVAAGAVFHNRHWTLILNIKLQHSLTTCSTWRKRTRPPFPAANSKSWCTEEATIWIADCVATEGNIDVEQQLGFP
ncbi:hypothetical protein Q5P01_010698 [Channa striata]|uniref:Uncharacterized protein n=1 Tax=Channa striata TaxID=64152 RepID=A0AA88MSZ6_CHASR|nr:hypothetical protein Q5P01_010698 [Channa striata]